MSVVTPQNGKKVVAGTQDGIVNLYTWGNWGDLDDRFTGKRVLSVCSD
jgi:hypothetical protein